jgi:arylsulfatase A-like enzyme
MRPGSFWLLAGALGLVLGCGENPQPPQHVVVFLIDTLRADQLGAYGSRSGATPHLDALAAESVVFEAASAPAPWTLPSVASLMTSTFPCEHGVLVDGDLLPESIIPLAERLRADGFGTISLYANPYAGEMSGLVRGFDHYRQGFDANGRAVERALDRTLDGKKASRIFLYVHNTGPHDPYHETERGPETEVSLEERKTINRQLQQLRRLGRVDFAAKRPIGTVDNTKRQQTVRTRLRKKKADVLALYAKDVAGADARLGQVVAVLKERGVFENAVFVLVSDHGEEFDEHGGWQHDQSVYEELLHVPLMIRFPNARFAGRRVEANVSLVDLIPTLADVLEQPELAAGTRGRSLLPLIEGRDEPEAIRITGMRDNRKKFYRPAHQVRGDVNIVARKGKWKSIWNVDTGTVELYDLTRDPQERTNLASERARTAEELREASERWRDACRPAAGKPAGPRSLDPETLERLRALGYAD